MNRIAYYGRQGKILGELSNFCDQQEKTIPPQVTIDSSFFASRDRLGFDINISQGSLSPRKYVDRIYSSQGNFGHFGDLIIVSFVRKNPSTIRYTVELIGRFTFPTPTLAADLLPIITNGLDSYFVFIRRKYDPGRGGLALVGGIMEIRPDGELETPLSCIQREAEEEIGFRFNLLCDPDEWSENFSREKISASFTLPGIPTDECSAHIALIGAYRTSSSEASSQADARKIKRVHMTYSYAIKICVTGELTMERMQEFFRAGDDAEEVVFVPRQEDFQLVFGHHNLIARDLKKKFIF